MASAFSGSSAGSMSSMPLFSTTVHRSSETRMPARTWKAMIGNWSMSALKATAFSAAPMPTTFGSDA